MAKEVPNLMYPRSVANTGYYMSFYAYDYNKAQALNTKSMRDMLSGAIADTKNGDKLLELESLDVNTGGTTATDTTGGWGRDTDTPSNTMEGVVKLYIPPKLEYKYGAEWNATQFGAVGAGLGGAGNALGSSTASVTANMFDKIIGNKLNEAPKAEGISGDTLMAGAFGMTFNDNTLQTFTKMKTRSFSFQYMLAARNKDEEQDIKKIIKFFKMAMHPGSKRSGTNTSLFLTYPYIFRIIQSGKTKGQNKWQSSRFMEQFLPSTKYCAITDVTVDYTPHDVFTLTRGNFVQAVSLSLQFSELTNLTRQDIHEVEDTATSEDWGWVEAQREEAILTNDLQEYY